MQGSSQRQGIHPLNDGICCCHWMLLAVISLLLFKSYMQLAINQGEEPILYHGVSLTQPHRELVEFGRMLLRRTSH